VPLRDQQNPEHRGIDWLAVARTLLFQALVLLALAGAFVGYVNWSSEQAVWEFINASEHSVPASHRASESKASVHTVNGQAFCRWKGLVGGKIDWQALSPATEDANGRDKARP